MTGWIAVRTDSPQVSQLVKAGGLIYAMLPKDGLETIERLHAGVNFDMRIEVTLSAPDAQEVQDKPRHRPRA